MTWLTRILAILNILAATALAVLAGIAIDARLAWTKALEDLDRKYRDGAATAQLLTDVGERSRDDLVRIRDYRTSQALDAAIVGLVELLKDPAQRPALLDHLKVEHPRLAESIRGYFEGNDAEAVEKSRKLLREALADLPDERSQRYEAAQVLFCHAFESEVISGLAQLLAAAAQKKVDDPGSQDLDRLLQAFRLQMPAASGPLLQSMQGRPPAEIAAAVKETLQKRLADLGGNVALRQEESHMLFMIFAAHAAADEFTAAMKRLPAVLEPIQKKLGPELAALVMEDFNRFLAPRLLDEQVRLRHRGAALRAVIADLKSQIAENEREIARYAALVKRQEALTRAAKEQADHRHVELAELNVLLEEATNGRDVANNRLVELKALLALRTRQYQTLQEENFALEQAIADAEKSLSAPRQPERE